jgi:hypothetical protein
MKKKGLLFFVFSTFLHFGLIVGSLASLPTDECPFIQDTLFPCPETSTRIRITAMPGAYRITPKAKLMFVSSRDNYAYQI